MTADLALPRRVHVVGVGGAGMSAIAEVLVAMGHVVSGSDLRRSPVLDRLESLGLHVHVGHDPAGADACELLVASTAVPPTDPELQAARHAGIPVLRRADVLAAVCAQRRTLAVAGTHGKTTTSAFAALALEGSGLRPSWVVGAPFGPHPSGGRWDGGAWLVVEADESDGTFLELPVEVAVVTSVEPDHLEHHGSFEALRDAFARFLAAAPGPRLACADDAVAAEVGRLQGARLYGTAAHADVRVTDLRLGRHGTAFVLEDEGTPLGEVHVPLPGRHNALNAAGAVAAALVAGADFASASAAVGRASRVARRFEWRGERDGVTFVDDYAHLPGEVAAALGAAADGRWQRLVCVFQPHRYSRTEALATSFGSAFDAADVLVLTDVYPAGEQPRPGVSGLAVAEAVRRADESAGRRRPVLYVPRRQDLADEVAPLLRAGDLCLTLGAGDVTTLADELLADPAPRPS